MACGVECERRARERGAGTQGDAEGDHQQRCRNDAQPGPLPDPAGFEQQQQGESAHGDQNSERRCLGEQRLRVREAGLGLGAVAQRQRNLGGDQDQTDRREHALDHAAGHEGADTAEPQHTEQHLQRAGEQGGEQQAAVAELLDSREHDHGESGGGPADTQLRAGGERNHQAADHAGNQAGDRRRPGGDGNTQTQWNGDEEDDDAGTQVAPGMTEIERVR